MDKKGKLLIVDDEPHLIKVLEYTLKDLAETITVAENGKDAISIIRNENIDCVLCDINLPRMNGIDVIRIVRSEGHRVPFVFFTGKGDRESLIEAARHGALDFLYKPYLDAVHAAVFAGLHSSSYRPRPESDYGKILRELDL